MKFFPSVNIQPRYTDAQILESKCGEFGRVIGARAVINWEGKEPVKLNIEYRIDFGSTFAWWDEEEVKRVVSNT
jgi:hypothetical protein